MLKLYRRIKIWNEIREFSMAVSGDVKVNSNVVNKKVESARMKKFHEQLKLEKMSKESTFKIGMVSGVRFVDPVLVDTNPNNELIPNGEKNPTKWGDWQHGGRVTDF